MKTMGFAKAYQERKRFAFALSEDCFVHALRAKINHFGSEIKKRGG
jgi:hypothetical protein